MNLVRWNKANALDPGREFDRLQNEINKLFDFTYPDAGGLFDRHFNPAVDITETNDAFKVMLDLPGVNRKDVDVSIAGNVLTVKGEKKEEKKREGAKLYRSESWNGSFQRTLSLPDGVDPDKVSAAMADGVLTITLAKREEVKPKQISVKVQ
ncbi:Hsp20/alpha crystallin family protein [Sediminispirochaeta smaragdinae]|uniref:Heat shock protein Hsp20 n=1 Tax=Sediminispirochaeta smaragdinae (strain DSM 11293 / JCM 15392 / SEBR 4228) TaxID=573413 RepID=E1R647_SEDSS|nr:Hsp20/alpha crystallin family protein [Sediminispirochaeta smaragdinae]ADK80812.1 heat shock protein Hsp20 [Sediminispirochaeta smaragdinae DSM 11293]